MSAGFTPGPWSLSDKAGNIMRDILGADGSPVCSVFNVRHHMLKNPQPDTDLILAAPDLVAAVELAIPVIEEEREITVDSNTVLYKGSPDVGKVVDPYALGEIAKYDAALNAMRAALAKVRGETNG